MFSGELYIVSYCVAVCLLDQVLVILSTKWTMSMKIWSAEPLVVRHCFHFAYVLLVMLM